MNVKAKRKLNIKVKITNKRKIEKAKEVKCEINEEKRLNFSSLKKLLNYQKLYDFKFSLSSLITEHVMVQKKDFKSME